MADSKRKEKIDADATIEDHFTAIRSQGESYLTRALQQNASPVMRQRIVQASLRYLEVRNRVSQASQAPALSQSQGLMSQATAAKGRDSSFHSILASLLDQDISTEVLVNACAKAADCQVAPVLTKCLFILASRGSISHGAAKDSSLVVESQSQYNDEELFDVDITDSENIDPRKDLPPSGQRAQNTPRVGKENQSEQVVVRRTGQSFVDEFVTRLADPVARKSLSQDRASDVFVASVVKESPLSEGAVKNILIVLTKRMDKVELFELPAFIYQLLLFASTRASSAEKSFVLTSIASVFSKLEKTAKESEELSQSLLAEDEDAITVQSTTPRELRQVQGTALVHIEYAVKQDPTLSAEVLKLAKVGVETPKHFLTAFGMGIFLSMARAASTQVDILSVLRDTIARFDRERSLRAQNLYMARVAMNDEEMLDPQSSLLYIAECTCENGWDYVKESLLHMALLLLDKPLPSVSQSEESPESLGEHLIFKLFNAHKSIRGFVLEQLTSRIALQEKSAFQAVSVIKKLADRIPFFVLEHCRYLRDGIEFLVALPPWLASALISAYKPLLVARQDLQDYFQLVVRKALFHRDMSSRAVAIIGFLNVTSLCGSNSSSSGRRIHGSSQRPGSSSGQSSTVDAMLDSLQPLRRIFSYSAALRAFLYKNAIHILLQTVPDRCSRDVANAIGELLRSHLRRFVNPMEAPYILLEHCVQESAGGRLLEPLGDLIWCLAVVESKREAQAYKDSYIIDLARKLASVSLQDFTISKELLPPPGNDARDGMEEDEAASSAAACARANRNRLRVLGSVCEALIHAILIVCPDLQEWSIYSEVLLPLFMLRAKILELLRSVGAASSSDAFNDLGGDITIERMRPGTKMILQRGGNGKSGGFSKKGSSSRKAKPKEPNSSSVSGPGQVPEHRFGAFSVLCSATTRPVLPLKVALKVLQMMNSAFVESAEDDADIFTGQSKSRDFQELRVYILAIAQRHIEDYIYSMAKEQTARDSEQCSQNEMLGYVRDLAKIAMNDFKRFRRSTSHAQGQGGFNALQIAERCACAMTYLQKSVRGAITSFCQALMPDSTEPVSTRSQYVCQTETATEALENLIESLIDDELLKESMIVIRMHDSVAQSVSRSLDSVEGRANFLDKRVQWASNLLAKKRVGEAGVVKCLVHTCLVYTENNNDLRRAGSLGQCLLNIIGDCDESAEPNENEADEGEQLCRAAAIEHSTCLLAVDAVFDVIDHAIVDVEWCLGRMNSLESGISGTPLGDVDHLGPANGEGRKCDENMLAKQAIRAEDAAQLRLEGIVRILQVLARCAIAKWAQQERLLRLITKTYKMLCLATQAQCKRKGDPRTSFVSLINECKSLAPTLWTLLAFVGTGDGAEAPTKGASRAAREARVMPQLVYEVERFEKVLIGAQKRTKINLLRGMRRNIARDFRIREDRLANDDSSSDQENDGTEPRNRQVINRKRQRTS